VATITAAKFLAELSTSVGDVVNRRVFGGDPWVFRDDPKHYALLKAHLVGALGISADGITVVGSAKIGFSLSPDTFGRPFSDSSDVDVVIVDLGLFDELWNVLLDWRYPWHLRKWPEREREWGLGWLERFVCGWCDPIDIMFGGIVAPRSYPPIRDFSRRWFDAFKSLATHPDLAGRDFVGRLYRSWDHALRYQSNGLNQVLKRFPRKSR